MICSFYIHIFPQRKFFTGIHSPAVYPFCIIITYMTSALTVLFILLFIKDEYKCDFLFLLPDSQR